MKFIRIKSKIPENCTGCAFRSSRYSILCCSRSYNCIDDRYGSSGPDRILRYGIFVQACVIPKNIQVL